jgi:hypothetical protein
VSPSGPVILGTPYSEMILIIALAVSIAAALLRGGRFAGLACLHVRWGLLAILSFGVQTLFIYQKPVPKTIGVWGWQELALMGSYVLLLATTWANRHLHGMALITLGLLLNLVVMAANGGWMPIAPEAVRRAGLLQLAPSLTPGMRIFSSKDIILLREQTRLWLLSDIFVLSKPFPVASVFCVGDVVSALGAFALLQRGMLGHAGRQHAESSQE